MYITRLVIQRYGPLENRDFSFNKAVQVVYGLNESGKTLMIDFLLKVLTGKSRFADPKLDRVTEKPQGFPVFEENGQSFTLGEGETIIDRLGISAEEFRNIFVVRDADLRMVGEDQLYSDVTDKITGLQSNKIQKIVDKLRDLGRLTLALTKISDKREHKHAETNLKAAQRLKKEILNYLPVAKEKQYEKLEFEISQLGTKKTQLKALRDSLQKAKEKADFEVLDQSLEKYTALEKQLGSMPSEKQIRAVRDELEHYDEEELKKPNLERTQRKIQNVSFLALALFFSATVITTLARFVEFASFAILSLLSALVVSIVAQFWLYWNTQKLSKAQRTLVSLAADIDLSSSSIDLLRKSLSELEKNRQKTSKELHETRGTLKTLLSPSKIDDSELATRTKEELARRKKTIDFELDLLFNPEEFQNAENEMEETGKQLEELEKQRTDHNDKLAEFSTRAGQIDFQGFLRKPLDLVIGNIESLNILLGHLNSVIGNIEERAELSRIAIGVFTELAKEEQRRVEALFGEGSSVSTFFQRITNGKYRTVVYDSLAGKIYAESDDGTRFTPEQLSKGTRDQLYLAVRVSLGSELLKGKPGFFIMDDAFVSSDKERFTRQVHLVKELADKGWQTIYFTPHEEAAKALETISDGKAIVLEQL